NLLRTHMRSEARKSRAYQCSGAALLDDAPDDDEVADRLDASLHGDTLTAALKKLSPGDREALLLYAWGDLSYDDIAVSLNIPVGTVRSRLNRARRQLRETLASSGVRPELDASDVPDSPTAAGGQ
ncbi:MAG: RNA polymerase sigma factor, partial [Thermoleophilia bacterium]|nr:RNA polymerase sigma factor [Thermoleophilia bacterium]